MSATPITQFPRPHLVPSGDQRHLFAALLRARDLLLQVGMRAATHANAPIKALKNLWAIRAAARTIGYLAGRLSVTRILGLKKIGSVALWAILGGSGGIGGITTAFSVVWSSVIKAVSTVRNLLGKAVSAAKARVRGLIVKVLSRKSPEDEELEAAVVPQNPQNPVAPSVERVPARPVMPVNGRSLNSQQRYPAKKASANHR